MIYLDNASYSFPKPEAVGTAMEQALQRPAGLADNVAVLEGVRRDLAALFGVSEPRRAVFTCNGTDALNMAIKGLLKSGDHVVTTSMERQATGRPLTHMQMKGSIALTRIEVGPEGQIDPGEVKRVMGQRTKLVVIPHACNVLGTVQPVEEIARLVRERDVRLLVDATATAGVIPIDLEGWGVDLLALSGHRGLFGPPGAGVLLLGRNVRLSPFREGASGGDQELSTQPLDLPWALESGLHNSVSIAGLGAGIRFVRQETVDRLREHQTTLIKRFIGALGLDDRFHLFAARGDLPRTGTVSFTLDRFPAQELHGILERTYNIRVAAGLHEAPGVHQALKTLPAGTLRVSAGWFNTEEQIDQAVASLREVADSGFEKARQLAGVQP